VSKVRKVKGIDAIRRILERRPVKAEGESKYGFKKRVSKFKEKRTPAEYTAKCRALEKVSAELEDILEAARLLAFQPADDKKICDDVEKILPVRKLSELLEIILLAELDHGRYWDTYIDLLFADAKDALRRKKGADLILQIGLTGDARCTVREAIRDKKEKDLPLFLREEKRDA
jgi:hypothetical protein